jgi:hypothetical protein
MKTLHFLFIYIFLSANIHARLFLDISVVSKKGIDSELTLSSELHATKEVSSTQPTVLTLKSGLEVTIQADFDEGAHEIVGGPSDKIILTGLVKDENGHRIKNFLDWPIHTYLDRKETIAHSLKNERIEITILPYMK